MQRISTPTRVIDKHGTGRDGFGDGNPQAGTPSTQLEAAWYDSSQEEIARAIELEGITLDPADMTQLHQAMLRVGGRYLPLTGGTLAGPGNLTVNGTLATPYGIRYDGLVGTNRVGWSWDTVTTPTSPVMRFYIDGVDEATAGATILLGRDPRFPLEAATKQYVDTFLPLAGGTMDLTVPFIINTQAVGGVTITANAGVNAGLAILTPADGNFSAQVSFTVGSRSFQSGVSGGGQFVIIDISPPIPNPGLTRFSIDAQGDVSINNSLYVSQQGLPGGLVVWGARAYREGGNPSWDTALADDFDDVGPYPHGLDVLRQIQPKLGTIDGQRAAGLVVDDILPLLAAPFARGQQLVDGVEQRIVNYSELLWMLVNSIKELADRVEALEAA